MFKQNGDDVDMFGNIERGARRAKTTMGAVGACISLIAGLIGVARTYSLIACVGMAVPLIRVKMGVRTMLFYGVLGAAALAWLSQFLQRSPLSSLLTYWWAALLVAMSLHTVGGAVRYFRGHHVHSNAAGAPHDELWKLYRLVLGHRALSGRWLSFVAEPGMLLTVSLLFAFAEWCLVKFTGRGLIVAWIVPALAAAGLFFHACNEHLKALANRQKYGNQEKDQVELAALLPPSGDNQQNRDSEGYVG